MNSRERIDKFLAQKDKTKSRAEWKSILAKGLVLINGREAKKSDLVDINDKITFLESEAPNENIKNQIIPVDLGIKIVFADDDIVVYDKPAGIATHPNYANETNSVLNQLVYDFPEIAETNNGTGIGEKGLRTGLVHRLDTHTRGVIVCAKTQIAYEKLREQFYSKDFSKTYIAVVYGEIPNKGKIETPIMHSPKSSKRMITAQNSDEKGTMNAKTIFHKIKFKPEIKISCETLSAAFIKTLTGRMHQIRIHFHSIGHSLYGDLIYKQKSLVDKICDINQTTEQSSGHFLIAHSISFNHPKTCKRIKFKSNFTLKDFPQ